MQKLKQSFIRMNKIISDDELKNLYIIIIKIMKETNSKDEDLLIEWISYHCPVKGVSACA